MALRMTETGIRVRDEAEVLTNKYFFAPWDSAPNSDLEAISTLLPKLSERLSAD
jgi:hypothetical protein